MYLITLEVAGRRPLLGRIAQVDAGEMPARTRRPLDQIAAADARATRPGGGAAKVPRGTPNAGGLSGVRVRAANLSQEELRAANQGLFIPSELGKRVSEEFEKISEHEPGIRVLAAQAMPDHFHGILFVQEKLPRHLGRVIAGFKGKCTQIAAELRARGMPARNQIAAAAMVPLWEPGYHDRILTHAGQLENMMRYVIDNPRRAALKAHCREFFTVVKRVKFQGQEFDAVGNAFLLEREEILPVQVSRRFFKYAGAGDAGAHAPATRPGGGAYGRGVLIRTPEFEAKRAALLGAATQGAVLCSPCISDGEKAISYEALEKGKSLIALRHEPFAENYKPSGRFFDVCAAGQLLVLYPRGMRARNQIAAAGDAGAHAPATRPGGGAAKVPREAPNARATRPIGGARKPRITRLECLELNAIAAEICGKNPKEIFYYGYSPKET